MEPNNPQPDDFQFPPFWTYVFWYTHGLWDLITADMERFGNFVRQFFNTTDQTLNQAARGLGPLVIDVTPPTVYDWWAQQSGFMRWRVTVFYFCLPAILIARAFMDRAHIVFALIQLHFRNIRAGLQPPWREIFTAALVRWADHLKNAFDLLCEIARLVNECLAVAFHDVRDACSNQNDSSSSGSCSSSEYDPDSRPHKESSVEQSAGDTVQLVA